MTGGGNNNIILRFTRCARLNTLIKMLLVGGGGGDIYVRWGSSRVKPYLSLAVVIGGGMGGENR